MNRLILSNHSDRPDQGWAGYFCIRHCKDYYTQLGRTVTIHLEDWARVAIVFNGDGTVERFMEPTEDYFKAIQLITQAVNDKNYGVGMYGVEFYGRVGLKQVEFPMMSRHSRMFAEANLVASTGDIVTLKSVKKQHRDHTWYAIERAEEPARGSYGL